MTLVTEPNIYRTAVSKIISKKWIVHSKEALCTLVRTGWVKAQTQVRDGCPWENLTLTSDVAVDMLGDDETETPRKVQLSQLIMWCDCRCLIWKLWWKV